MRNAKQTTVQNLAVQMYSLRKLTEPLDEILREVSAAGYAGIETVGLQGVSADELAGRLEKHNLTVVSSHVGVSDLERSLNSIITSHKILGNNTLVVPGPALGEVPDTAADWRRLGKRLSKLAVACDAAGMSLLYHNHDFEMKTVEGRTALEWLLTEAPETLGVELDLAWVVRGGEDPLALLEKLAGRVKRVHVKDVAPTGHTLEDGWADVGSGTLAWDVLLPAAKAAGTDWYVVEHDKPDHPLASIRNSARYLRERV